MWEPGVIVSLIVGVVALLGNIISVTVFVMRLGGKIDEKNAILVGKIDVVSNRVGNVETALTDLRTTDRRLSVVEDRQSALAMRQGNMEKDCLLIRDDLGKLHQGLDRHVTSLQRFNEEQFRK